ncbi:MAG TPA: hypothetical protein VN625_04270 [Desulfuromonadaceae bacterium]|nr:hypothetical protein [Desulfuromonadaceae bacterium]
MEIHEILKIAGGICTLLLFVPLVVQTNKDGAAGQSFSTWFLWAIMDSTLAVSTLVKHGNFLLPMGFACGSVFMTGLLISKKRFGWGWIDTTIATMVVGCLVGWYLGGARTAIVCTTIATSLATIPGLIEMWKSPQRIVGNIWGGYTLANGLSLLGGSAWSIEERFTPAIFTGLSLLMYLASLRRARS